MLHVASYCVLRRLALVRGGANEEQGEGREGRNRSPWFWTCSDWKSEAPILDAERDIAANLGSGPAILVSGAALMERGSVDFETPRRTVPLGSVLDLFRLKERGENRGAERDETAPLRSGAALHLIERARRGGADLGRRGGVL